MTSGRRGQSLPSEQLFHLAKIVLILLVLLGVLGAIAVYLFKMDIGSLFGGG